jgi:hypothetical protein
MSSSSSSSSPSSSSKKRKKTKQKEPEKPVVLDDDDEQEKEDESVELIIDPDDSSSSYKFIEKVDPDLECPVCLQVVNEASVECPKCNKPCCLECSKRVKQCPGCQCHATSWRGFNLILKGKRDKLKIRCATCEKEEQLGSWPAHKDKYCMIACPQLCGKTMQKQLVEEHVSSDCPETEIQCACQVQLIRFGGEAKSSPCQRKAKRKDMMMMIEKCPFEAYVKELEKLTHSVTTTATKRKKKEDDTSAAVKQVSACDVKPGMHLDLTEYRISSNAAVVHTYACHLSAYATKIAFAFPPYYANVGFLTLLDNQTVKLLPGPQFEFVPDYAVNNHGIFHSNRYTEWAIGKDSVIGVFVAHRDYRNAIVTAINNTTVAYRLYSHESMSMNDSQVFVERHEFGKEQGPPFTNLDTTL